MCFSGICSALVRFCICWDDDNIFPVDPNISLDILHILSVACTRMVCSYERVSKEYVLEIMFYKTRSMGPFC